jgi:hypothetical protein
MFCYLGVEILADSMPVVAPSRLQKAKSRMTLLSSLLRSDRGLPVSCSLRVYVSVIQSIYMYASPLLPLYDNGCNVKYSSARCPLYMFEKECLRVVLSCYHRTHIWCLYSELGLVRLKILWAYRCLKFCLSSLYSLAPSAVPLLSSLSDAVDLFSKFVDRCRSLWCKRNKVRLSSLPPQCMTLSLKELVVSSKMWTQYVKEGIDGASCTQTVLVFSSLVAIYKSLSCSLSLEVISALHGVTSLRSSKGVDLHSLFLSDTAGRKELYTKVKSCSRFVKSHVLTCEETWAKRQAEKKNDSNKYVRSLSRVLSYPSGAPYLCEFDCPSASLAFLIRTSLRFNPQDKQDGPCRLCGEKGGDNPVHLFAFCEPRLSSLASRLRSIRSEIREIACARATCAEEILQSLVGRVYGVTQLGDLKEERVKKGVKLLAALYRLRKAASSSSVSSSSSSDSSSVLSTPSPPSLSSHPPREAKLRASAAVSNLVSSESKRKKK